MVVYGSMFLQQIEGLVAEGRAARRIALATNPLGGGKFSGGRVPMRGEKT